MFCVKCGKQIEPDTSFCVHCGHKFNATPPPKPLKRRSWIPFILIFTFTSVISLGILVWALFYEDTSSYSADIVGRWTCSTDEGFGTYWIFNNDNTCVYYVPEMYGNARTGYTDTLDSRYRISGNVLTFTHSDGVSASWRISINGDELKLYMSDGQLFDIYWKDLNYYVQSPVFQPQSADSNTSAVQSAEVHNTARGMEDSNDSTEQFYATAIQKFMTEAIGKTSAALVDLNGDGVDEMIALDEGVIEGEPFPFAPRVGARIVVYGMENGRIDSSSIETNGQNENILENYSHAFVSNKGYLIIGFHYEEASDTIYKYVDGVMKEVASTNWYYDFDTQSNIYFINGMEISKEEFIAYWNRFGVDWFSDDVHDIGVSVGIYSAGNESYSALGWITIQDDTDKILSILPNVSTTTSTSKDTSDSNNDISSEFADNSLVSVGESDVTTAMRDSDPELFDAMFGGIESDDGNNDDNATNNKQATSESDAGMDSEILRRALLRVLDEDDKRISYEGDMINGVSHGFGFAKYNDGSMYEGEFQYGLKNGEGIYYFVSGDTYYGQFVNGSMSGYGTYYWANGKRYTGEFPGIGTLFVNGVTIAGTATKTDKGWSFGAASTSPSTEFITIKGEQYSVSLTGQLYLGDKELNDEDIKPLAYMVNLTELNLDNNQISNLSSLSGLTNLTALTLDGNQISDLSPLASLTNLTGLSLMSNQISALSPLSNLTNLTWLELNGNQISDLSSLSGLTNLTSLSLYSNPVTDWAPVAHILGVGGRPN